ncbi:MAG: GH92 family glycosyl hydrolase [Bacteroidales bacterium]|nr:GH92 family glycosyl hydrolase [Bacteroidales bacterium]
MKYRNILFALVCLAVVACSHRPEASTGDPVDHVSVLVGTMSKHSLSTGNTYPAIARPWGMNFWTPQTGTMGDGWTYCYTADRIRGFKQTHQPSPWINDYGQFALMPVTGDPVFNQEDRASWFSHKAEEARPYYYGVYLADHDVYVELTPTERAAAFRIKYPEDEKPYLVVDAFDNGSYIKVIPEENRIVGYTTKNSGGVPSNFRNWFVIESDTPFDYVRTVSDGSVQSEETESQSAHSGAVVGFSLSGDRKVNLKVASSFISIEQALVNMQELGDGDFDRIKTEGRARWNEILGRIRVEDDNIDNIRTFYSCLYRSVLFPRTLTETTAEGELVHYSPHTGEVCPGYFFTDTGFWDTFRCLFPLLNLVYPEMNVKMQEGLVNAYKESGFLPEWASPGHRGCMVGNNSASVVADAHVKGIRGYDIETLWEAVKHGADAVHPHVSSTGRLGWDWYNRLGYVPCDVGINESAARTLEYAYDDWCIYTLGEALGRPEEEIGVYKERAMNYRNLYREEFSLMSGRKADGSFSDNFSPLKWGGDFTEGNALHYTWSVFHDPAGLMALMGGEDAFNANLDKVFEIPPHFDDSYYGFTIHEIREMQIMNMGNYAHGNQPIQHMLYLYNWSGQPWKAQQRIREVMDRFYTCSPDGYCGDEDNGQTSAWYVFSAMGFYPVCPATDQYVLGTPLFKKVEVTMPGGKILSISAPDNGKENFYISDMKVNGKRYTRTYLEHDLLTEGADIRYTMSDRPSKTRSVSMEDRPYSFSN